MSLVSEFYDINDEEIKKLAATGEAYWLKVRDFWWSIKERDANRISPGQASWLSKIEEDLSVNWRPLWMETEGAVDAYAE